VTISFDFFETVIFFFNIDKLNVIKFFIIHDNKKWKLFLQGHQFKIKIVPFQSKKIF